MLVDEFIYQLQQDFPMTPTEGQRQVMEEYARFMGDRRTRVAMILRGSAGTGKTTVAAAIVRTMVRLKQKVVLLAPTGRAAKVFALYAGLPASTIHRHIYVQRTFDAGGGTFQLNYNKHRDTLFIIDESSMISNRYSGSPFGSGCLLDDLMQYVCQGDNCRALFIGDRAQLPPVGEEESPALSRAVIESYGMTVYECDLDEVLRQSQESGILWNATKVRRALSTTQGGEYEACGLKVDFSFPDTHRVPGNELIEALTTSYSRAGMDDTIVITRSNKLANIYNIGIRNQILDREEELCRGDRLMVVKNKYSSQEKRTGSSGEGFEFLANGDIAIVQRVRNVRELYGFRFADVLLSFPDYDGVEQQQTVILDTLTSEAPALTKVQQEKLFQAVLEDYADIPYKRDRLKKVKEDPYYNALQVKYAYAVTCHKAQGGQWAHVYIDQGYMTDEMVSEDYYHWLYTAFTRATEQLFLVNWRQ